MIAHLKDQLQEMKAKTGLEAKYVKKEAQVLYLIIHIFQTWIYCIVSLCFKVESQTFS